MKNTMINKFSCIISLWLIAIITTLIVFGYQLNVYALYIAATVVGLALLLINVFTIVSGIISANKRAIEGQREYEKF